LKPIGTILAKRDQLIPAPSKQTVFQLIRAIGDIKLANILAVDVQPL
jgi:hypothetical protein